MINTINELVTILDGIKKNGSKVVYFARAMSSGYLVSRDEFIPAAKSKIHNVSGNNLTVNGKKFDCKWSMYVFDQVKEAIGSGERFEFKPNAHFIEVAYEVAQQIRQWSQFYRMYDADIHTNTISFSTEYGRFYNEMYGYWDVGIKDTNYGHRVSVSFDEIEGTSISVDFKASTIEKTFDCSAVRSTVEFNKVTSFEYRGEKYNYQSNGKKEMIERLEEIDGIPAYKFDYDWKDSIEHEYFPGGRDAHNAKKVGRKIKATRDGKFYIATVKTLSISRHDEHYINENGHHSLDEWYDMVVEWNEYEECSKEDVEKVRSDFFTRVYFEEFWKVFYRFASKEEYEAAYSKAYGDGVAVAKATKLLEEKIKSFKEVLESKPFAVK